MAESTIGEIALKLVENKLKLGENSSEGIICLGTKGAGKSSLINLFLDKDEAKPKETLALEYTYGRKNVNGQYSEKNVCHVWELGGGIRPTKELLSVPVDEGGVTVALVMVNLEMGHSIWHPLKEYVTMVTTRPLYIVGGMYDKFQKLDSKERSVVYRMLRGVALLTGAGVFVFSNKDQVVMRKAKDLLNQLMFVGSNGSHTRAQVGDVERPLQVLPDGAGDSWEALGCGRTLGWAELQEWLIGKHNVEVATSQPPLDPSMDISFKEPLIDALRIQRDKELEGLVLAHGRSYL